MADDDKDKKDAGAGTDAGTSGTSGSSGGSGDQAAADEAQWKQLEDLTRRVTGEVIDERLKSWQPPAVSAPQGDQKGQEGQGQGQGQDQEKTPSRSQKERKPHWLEKWMNWPGPMNPAG